MILPRTPKAGDHDSDLQFLVELRGFEHADPLDAKDLPLLLLSVTI
jgi:hypothetical protein